MPSGKIALCCFKKSSTSDDVEQCFPTFWNQSTFCTNKQKVYVLKLWSSSFHLLTIHLLKWTQHWYTWGNWRETRTSSTTHVLCCLVEKYWISPVSVSSISGPQPFLYHDFSSLIRDEFIDSWLGITAIEDLIASVGCSDSGVTIRVTLAPCVSQLLARRFLHSRIPRQEFLFLMYMLII